MLIKTYGAAVQGIDAIRITIEAIASTGATFNMVGLADTAVRESYQRIMAAVTQSGYDFPRLRFVVNLSPADVKKEGAAYDLPIAIAILAASTRITVPALDEFMIMGEALSRRVVAADPRSASDGYSRPEMRIPRNDCASRKCSGGGCGQ